MPGITEVAEDQLRMHEVIGEEEETLKPDKNVIELNNAGAMSSTSVAWGLYAGDRHAQELQ